MKHIKKWFCLLLALLMALGPMALAEPAPTANEASPVYYEHDGRVTFVDGDCAGEPVRSSDDAARVVSALSGQLGGDEKTQLDPWRTLTDAFGNTYFVFQQMHDDTTVLGGAVKVIADRDGKMIGLTSSLVNDLPKDGNSDSITAEAAERIVRDYALENEQRTLTVLDGMTARMILPRTLSIDMEAEDDEGSRYVWVVYTDNPGVSAAQGSDMPYLAHYVTLEGEYLYSLPTLIPGDEAGATGFDSSYLFSFMEPVDYTGYVTLSDGTEKELTVTVMRDKRTGMYYLGNIERRIVVADCYEFLYGDHRVVLEYSPDNLEWDATGLLSLYNYCRAWDYYQAIGWNGGDGLGTPMLILNNFCDALKNPVDNAGYAGGYLGWQIFLASAANDYSQCLDVIAHEFTHCVTGSVMTYNSYQNDYGAINEAMSDIQGKLCEMLMEGAENVAWELGDQSLTPVRSMSEPHRYSQPEFSWDLYYKPNVKTPTIVNDYGGVHTNSSLLNYAAYLLFTHSDMTLEEARAYWFTVDCAMVPGTDYAQLRELLPWALKAAGMEQYATEMNRAIDVTRLGDSALPNTVDDDRALVTLTLPEGDTFSDGNWSLTILSIDFPGLLERIFALTDKLESGDTDGLPALLVELNALSEEPSEPVGNEDFGQMLMDIVADMFTQEPEDEADAPVEPVDPEVLSQQKAEFDELADWAQEYFGDVLYADTGAAGQDGLTVRMTCRPGSTVPLLSHFVYNEETSEIDQLGAAFFMNDRWYDLTGFIQKVLSMEDSDLEEPDPSLFGDLIGSELVNDLIKKVMQNLDKLDSPVELVDVFAMKLTGGEVIEIPGTGLEKITLPESNPLSMPMDEDASRTPAQKSRPKLPEDEAPEDELQLAA